MVTAADVPGKNHIQLIFADQPCLADGAVNHCDEPILLLAHPDKHKLREAADAVQIEYEQLPAVFSIDESERQEVIVWGTDNVIKSFLLEKGDVDAAWSRAAHIVEGEYRTGAQEHLYIENNGVIAEWSEQSGITAWGSLQCPFYVHKSLMAVFDLPEDKVRVIQTETGGAFGGKEDYPSTLASHRGGSRRLPRVRPRAIIARLRLPSRAGEPQQGQARCAQAATACALMVSANGCVASTTASTPSARDQSARPAAPPNPPTRTSPAGIAGYGPGRPAS